MINYSIEKIFRTRIGNKSLFLDFLIVFSAFLFVFVSSDANVTLQLDFTIFFRELFYSGIFHERFFKVFDVFFIALSLTLLARFGKKNIPSSTMSSFFISVTILNTIIIFVNPNHDARFMFLGLPLLSDISLYTWLIFMYMVFFIERDGLVYFLKYFSKYVIIFAVVKSLLLIYLWAVGSGLYFEGFYSILMEEDNLLLFAFLQLLSMALFLQNKNFLFLSIWFLLMCVEVLSFRRSGVTISLFSLALLLVYSQAKFTKAAKLIFVIFIGFFVLISLPYIIEFLPYTAKLYIARYVGEFIALSGVPVNLDFQYNQHLGQSEFGLAEALAKLPFWGYGYGQNIFKATIYYGGNTAIHNAFVSAWMFHSLFFSVYLVVLLLISLYYSIRLFVVRVNRTYGLIMGALVFFLFAFYLDHWVLPLANVVEVKMVIFRTIIFAAIFRLTAQDIQVLIKNKNRE